MSRWKASLIHLTISFTIATTVLVLMLLLWYAPPFFSAAGGNHVLYILMGVDVTLGPFITLLIFDINKSRRALTFDLSVIAILQISALIYGVSIMFHARPVFVVFSKDSFDLVTANLISDADLNRTGNAQFRTLPLTGPVYVYTALPTDKAERNEVVLAAFSGKDLPQFPEYYQPYAEHMPDVARSSRPIAELKKLNPGNIAKIEQAVSATHRKEEELGYLPLRAKYQNLAVIVGNNDGKVLTALPLQAW